jgi:LysM repeat protein
VQGGDTLFAIAQRNNTSIDAIVAANNLPNRNSTLSIGQKLIIP